MIFVVFISILDKKWNSTTRGFSATWITLCFSHYIKFLVSFTNLKISKKLLTLQAILPPPILVTSGGLLDNISFSEISFHFFSSSDTLEEKSSICFRAEKCILIEILHYFSNFLAPTLHCICFRKIKLNFHKWRKRKKSTESLCVVLCSMYENWKFMAMLLYW